jgi:hypothetical protein
MQTDTAFIPSELQIAFTFFLVFLKVNYPLCHPETYLARTNPASEVLREVQPSRS